MKKIKEECRIPLVLQACYKGECQTEKAEMSTSVASAAGLALMVKLELKKV